MPTRIAYQERLTTLCLVAALGLYILQVAGFWDYTNDDAFITYRYSRHLADGHGPYYNPGQNVEGYTNFSQMLLMASTIRLMSPEAVPTAGKVLGVVFGLLSIFFSCRLCRYLIAQRMGAGAMARLWAACAACVIAVSPDFAVNSTSGLETTLFSFSLTLGVYLGTLEGSSARWRGSGLAFGLAFLTRPESVFLYAVFWLAQAAALLLPQRWVRSKGAPDGSLSGLARRRVFNIMAVNAAAAASVLLLHLLFRYVCYDGELLPNTFWAKSGAFWMLSAWSYISEGTVFALLCTLGVVLAVAGFILSQSRAVVFLPLAAIVLAGAFLPFITGLDWMIGKRLIIPYLPLLAALSASGFCLLMKEIPRLPHWAGPAAVSILVGAMWLHQGSVRDDYQSYIALRSRGYRTGHDAMAQWLDSQLQPGDAIALMDIGIVGYRLIDREVIDISGLTDRFIAKSPGAFLRKLYDPKYIIDKHPEFIILTLTTPGLSYEPIESGAPLNFWTRIEQGIYNDPFFQEAYVHRHPADNSDPAWLKATAFRFGAERIFEHGYPDRRYLLAVFQRGSR